MDLIHTERAGAMVGRRGFLGMALAGTLLVAGCSRSSKTTLIGTEMNGSEAPDFTLTDQTGVTRSLSDFRGKAVALSFIFTNCPDICPLIGYQMRSAYDLLPEDERDDAVFLAVTVDPERDTPEALQAFSERHELDAVPNWYALWGSRDDLEAVWSSYGIEAIEIAEEVNSHTTGGAGVPKIRHTDAIYVIDKDGKQRVLMHSDADPADLAANLKALG